MNEWMCMYVQCNEFSLSFFSSICTIFKSFLFSLPNSHFVWLHFVAYAEASNQNSKSATIEMYAPSSYNDTVTGETLSSVSEKSDSYSNEGSQPDYMVSTFSFLSLFFSIEFLWINCNWIDRQIDRQENRIKPKTNHMGN